MKSIITALLSVGLAISLCHGQTRDPFLWPFQVESVWNMPIHNDAWLPGNHEDANIDVTGAPSRFKAEGAQIFIEDTNDPQREFHRVFWKDRCSGNDYHYDNQYVHFPDSYTWDGEANGQKNSLWAMIKPDQETIWDGTVFTRCSPGNWVGGAWFGPDKPYSIRGSGTGQVFTSNPDLEDVDVWGHGASRVSALGGVIRKGELTSPESEPIRHPLKFTIYAKWYLASCDVYGGAPFKWPAQGADGYACDQTAENPYEGTNPDFVMGTLLALPPDLTKEDLGITTLAGRKIFDALQDYGGYPVEDAAWDNWQFFVEEEAVATDWPTGSHAGFRSGQFFDELQAMVSELHIIKNNTPSNIAGGPTSDHVNRVAPVACPLGTFGSGEMCTGGGDTTPPSGPTGLNSTSGDQQVSLDWNNNSESDLNGYNVYRSTTSGSGYNKINSSLISNSDYTDNSVSNGTAYYYVVSAVDNSSNESAFSGESSATPTSGGGQGSELTFTPTDDGSPNPGFTGSTVRIENGNNNRIGYFKFNVSGTSGSTVNTATLKLYCNGDDGNGTIRVYTGSHNNWSESNTSNLPSTSSLLGEISGNYNIGTWYSLDLSTSAFSGAGTYTLIVKHESTGSDAWFDSREAGNEPELVLNVSGSGDTTPPSTPYNLSANAGDGTVSLDWDDNGEGDLNGYNVYRSTTSGSGYSKLNGSLLSTSDYTDNSVSNGTTYYYVVTAEDDSTNESGYSSESSATPQASSGGYTEDFNDNSAQNWVVNTGTWNAQNQQYEQSYTVGSAISYYDGATFSDYTYTVNATPDWGNQFGVIFNYQDANNYYLLWLDADPKDTELRKIENGSSSAIATSTYSGGGIDQSYTLEIDNSSGSTTVSINGSVVFNNISTGTFGSGKIGLYANFCPVIFDNVSVTGGGQGSDTTPPSAPSNVTANAGDGTVSLDWDDNGESDLNGYNVYRSTTSGSGYSKLNGSLLSTSDYTDNGVSNGTTYYYVVTAEDNSANESGYSGESSATPLASTSYTEDFNDNSAQNWIVNAGTWNAQNQQYEQSASVADAISYYDGATFSDYLLSVEATPDWANQFGVIFNYQDANNYYLLWLDANPKDAELRKIENGSSSTLATSTYSGAGVDQIYTLEVDNSSNNTTVSINGAVVFNNISTNTFSSGKIGLYAKFCPVIFDNVSVGGSSQRRGIEQSVRINDSIAQEAEKILVYPNPVENTLNVVNFTFSKRVEILDLTGKVVISKTYKGKQIREIDVSSLKKGVYLLRLNGSTRHDVIRFIKN